MSLCGFHLGWHSDACPLLSEYVEGTGLGFPLLSCLFGRPGWRVPLLSGWFWSFPPPPGSAACVLRSPLLTCLCGAASQVGDMVRLSVPSRCAFRRLEGTAHMSAGLWVVRGLVPTLGTLPA